jgi:hypothetical protein
VDLLKQLHQTDVNVRAMQRALDMSHWDELFALTAGLLRDRGGDKPLHELQLPTGHLFHFQYARVVARLMEAEGLATSRQPPATVLDAYVRAVNEPVDNGNVKAARQRVQAAMRGATAAMAMQPAKRMEAAEFHRIARQSVPAGDAKLVAKVARVSDGREAAWAVEAMVAEVGKGHAFKCPNGHIYFIGECGGAIARSVCPDCRSGIGGAHHTLAAGNRAAGEVDGTALLMPNGAYAHGMGDPAAVLRALGPGWG